MLLWSPLYDVKPRAKKISEPIKWIFSVCLAYLYTLRMTCIILEVNAEECEAFALRLYTNLSFRFNERGSFVTRLRQSGNLTWKNFSRWSRRPSHVCLFFGCWKNFRRSYLVFRSAVINRSCSRINPFFSRDFWAHFLIKIKKIVYIKS